MTFQYSALQETFFKNIYKLPPAHYFILKDGKLDIKRYWEPKFEEDESKTLDQLVDQIKEVDDSIEMHQVSDVEVGSFLSSGIDSSYIAASFNGNKTFSVGFEYDKYNEVTDVKEFCKKFKFESYDKMISDEEFFGKVSDVQYYMDEPLADSSAIALYFVCNLASKHVKVALSGEGADELFGGYIIYRDPSHLKSLTRFPKSIRKLLGKVAETIPFKFKGKDFFIRDSKDVEERFIGNAFIFNEKEKKKLLKNKNFKSRSYSEITKSFYDKVKNKDDVTKMQYLDINMWLTGDILLKADKMSMANSLEVRVPYLDKEVFKIASQIPTKYRLAEGTTKYAFRRAASEKLPENVSKRRKLGFTIPIRVWLKEEKYYNLVKKLFTSKEAEKFFEVDELVELLDKHYQGKKDNIRKIWTIYTFLVWYDRFFIYN